ncbi:MAG: S16 family serine protease [Candidatus Aenigmatarchaeota archaeon]
MARYSYRKTNYSSYVFVLLLGILIGLSLGIMQTAEPEVRTIVYTESSLKPFYSELSLVAVDQDGNGVMTPLIVEAKPGSGKVLVDIDKPLFWTDTQFSIQTARYVAMNMTGIDLSNYDLMYSIKSNASVIGGPSAGAAIAIATIAALQNKTVNENVIITGTVESDGTIGEVGGILEKAKAAKDVGAEIFIVPFGQGEETYLKPNEKCTRRDGFIFCETTYDKVTVNIGKDVGIAVIEVRNVEEALKFFGL